MLSKDYPPQKEYSKIHKDVLFDQDDWSELGEYVDYLGTYCKNVGIEDKPERDPYSFELKSFFGTYKFASGRELTIYLNPDKISDEEKELMLKQIIEWLAILGPNLQASLELLNPCGMPEIFLGFSTLLNELTRQSR